ncbi:MAG: lysylphosphatidylglycerol synthase transmembrane domain-containing protein [Candidatus Aureabacteria bacterium]|nr:lysylphosphatidylglycerol synthase transmembrane domain-containing protein [Candidatus Auribacterota bacterium]
MRGSLKGIIISGLKVLLALAIIFFILWKKVDLREVLSHLQRMDRGTLLLCWLSYGGMFFLSARRWMVLVRVQGITVRYTRLIRYYFIGLFFNNVMLGSMGGDLVKAYCLARFSPSKKEHAIVSVLSDRMIGFITFFGIGIVGILANIHNARLRPISAAFLALFLVMATGLLILYCRDLLKKIPFVNALLRRLPFEQKVRRLYESLYSYRHHGAAVGEALAISCALQLFTIAVMFVVARAMGMTEVSYSQLLLLIPLIGTVFALPITPAGWGTGELAFCGLFGALGVSAARALSLDLVLRAMVLSWSLIGGVLYALPQRSREDHAGREKQY